MPAALDTQVQAVKEAMWKALSAKLPTMKRATFDDQWKVLEPDVREAVKRKLAARRPPPAPVPEAAPEPLLPVPAVVAPPPPEPERPLESLEELEKQVGKETPLATAPTSNPRSSVVISVPHAAAPYPVGPGHPHDTIVAELAGHVAHALNDCGIPTKAILAGTPRTRQDQNRKESRRSGFRKAVHRELQD